MAPHSVSTAAEAHNPDAPVRLDVAMPRGLYDRLTASDEAPRSRYHMATGVAEFVAEPGVSHEWRASWLSVLFSRIAAALEAAGHPFPYLDTGASRLLSDDGAFEPDASFFIGPERSAAAMRVSGYLDTALGHPVPDIVVEIDRSVDSSGKLAPYFRMGVREAWTWSPADGAHLWIGDADAKTPFRPTEASVALPGLLRVDLDRVFASRSPAEAIRRSRRVVERVTAAILAAG